jgi:serine/threonine-protein kinase
MTCQKGGLLDFVKVLDFGLVKNVNGQATRELTGNVRIGGTPLYMAPERLTSKNSVDLRADIYSVGAVAYCLLSGQPVFHPTDELNLLHQIVNEKPRRLGEVAADIPSGLERVVMDCLAKDPDQRPASAEELQRRLDSCRGIEAWTQSHAREWWEKHRPSETPSA